MTPLCFQRMAWSLAGDNKHGTVVILTVLCVGHFMYQYEDINWGFHKREAIERSTNNNYSLVKANQHHVTADTRVMIGSKNYASRTNTFRAIQLKKFAKHRSLTKINFSFRKHNISGPILTIFTYWSKSNETDLLRNNTVRNWSLFSPYLYPILFTNDTGLERDVRAMGWDSLPIIHAGKGVPVLKHMYLDAMKKIESPLYAFVNGDILFTQSLLETLVSVLQSDLYQNETVLVVGRRTNVLNVTRETTIDLKVLMNEAVKNDSVITFPGLDYLITSKTFPWRDMPEVVIGRDGFDNLVVESKKRKIAVIGATKTLLAVQQMTRQPPKTTQR